MDQNSVLTLLVVALSSFAPALIFLNWLRSGRKGGREPWYHLSVAFLFGAIFAVVIAITLEMLAMTLLSLPIVREYDIFAKNPSTITFLMVIIVAPFVEELAKLFGLMKFSAFMNQPRSGFVFGAAVGLGFAATENMLYEGSALMQGGVVLFFTTALIRSFSSTLMHGSATSVIGYGLARKRFGGGSWVPYYVLAVLMHATFNLFASFGGLFESQLGPFANAIGLAFAFILVVFSVRVVRTRIIS